MTGMMVPGAAALLSILLVLISPGALARQAEAPSPPPTAPVLPRGEVIETLASADDPAQTYALYLPTGYRPDRRWPILYALDARGRARLPAERFRAAAESLGWIVASSYRSSSDGDMEPNFAAMRAMWKDTHARLSIDDRRAYAAGFSGTVRAACALAMMAPGTLDGVIGAGAGFPVGHPPTRETPFPFFGVAGDADFNFYEVANLEEALAGAGLPHRIEFFAGGHEWMPEPLAFEALAWMDLQAMKRGVRERDPAALDPLWTRRLERARTAEREGRLFEAHRAYSGLVEDFAGIGLPAEVDAVREAAARIAATPGFRREREEWVSRRKRDETYLEEARRTITQALAAAPAGSSLGDATSAGKVLAELRIPTLRRLAAKTERTDEREEHLSAKRRLASLLAQTGFYLPRSFLETRDFSRAALALSIAAGIAPDDPDVWYGLAVAQASGGGRKRALSSLEKAVKAGFNDARRMEAEEAFAPLRQEAGFRRLVAGMRSSP
jgi:predicted esterase